MPSNNGSVYSTPPVRNSKADLENSKVDLENSQHPLLPAASSTHSLPDVHQAAQPPFHTNGHAVTPHGIAKTIPQLARQPFVHPDDGHWLKLPDGMIPMALTEPIAVVRVVLLVLQRTMQSTGSFPPREPYYVKLSYAYFMRGGRMPHRSVVRGLQTAVERGYLLRQRAGKQQWAYAIAWKK